MMLGSGLLYRGTSLSASPLVLCCVTGLLIGIAMLVVLPQAFESLLTKDEWPAERIFALFVSAPLIMFFLEHVIIDHEHVHAGGPAGGPDHTVCDENCDHGPNIPYAMKFPSAKEAGESTPLQPAEKEASGRCLDFGLLLRLSAWMMHAMLDGVLIGSADQLAVIIPLSFAILVCAMQDVAGLYIYFSSRGASTRFVATAIVLFAVAFPIGAGISLIVFREKNENALVLDVLRCVMAGLFVYMALFELAPPHAHGRGQNLKYFIAFSFGLISAYMADMFEDSLHSHQAELMDWISRG
jgi:zinc transporter ZupT